MRRMITLFIVLMMLFTWYGCVFVHPYHDRYDRDDRWYDRDRGRWDDRDYDRGRYRDRDDDKDRDREERRDH